MTTKAEAVGHAAGHHAHAALDNLKRGVWVFLASECIVFGSLIGTYLALWGRSTSGPQPHEMLAQVLPETIVATFILLLSGFTMALAVHAVRRGNVGGLQLWTLATIVLGAVFLAFKIKDYAHLVGEGWTFASNIGATTFYTVTGTHAVHLAVGLVWLLAVLVNSLRGRYSSENATAVECAGLYWHFVDMAWMVIFPVIYLLEFAR